MHCEWAPVAALAPHLIRVDGVTARVQKSSHVTSTCTVPDPELELEPADGDATLAVLDDN